MIGIISQARMGSSRLPGKIFKEINGKSLLQYHVDRLKQSGFEVFIATTENPLDDQVENFCKKENIRYLRGSEHNVLERYYQLAKKFDLKTIVRVTSDCPLIDGQVILSAVKEFQALPLDNTYLTNCQRRTFPRGFDFEIFQMSSLEKAFKQATKEFEKEHVTPYIWKTNPQDFQIVHFTRAVDDSKFRITVDEADDFLLVQKLILDYAADKLNCEEIIAILRANPALYQINSQVEQKKV